MSPAQGRPITPADVLRLEHEVAQLADAANAGVLARAVRRAHSRPPTPLLRAVSPSCPVSLHFKGMIDRPPLPPPFYPCQDAAAATSELRRAQEEISRLRGVVAMRDRETSAAMTAAQSRTTVATEGARERFQVHANMLSL
jgi:hypothetical protein